MPATLEGAAPVAEETGLHIQGEMTPAGGPIVASGDVTISGRVVKGSDITAAGSIKVGGDVEGARIICSGILRAAAGAIKGGRVAAYQGITCKSAGDWLRTPTELLIGIDEDFLNSAEKRVGEIMNTLCRSTGLRTQLEKLQKVNTNLTPSQKEQVTDLLFRADAAEKRASVAIMELKSRFLALETDSTFECVVTEQILPGVTIHFPGARIMITAPLKGPVKLYAKHKGKAPIIHAVDIKSGKTTVIESIAEVGRMGELQAELQRLEKSTCR